MGHQGAGCVEVDGQRVPATRCARLICSTVSYLTQPHSATHLVRVRVRVRVRTRVRVAAQGDARGELVEPDSLGALFAAVHVRAAALRHDEGVLHVHGREAHLVRGRVRVGFRVRVRVGVRVRVRARVEG